MGKDDKKASLVVLYPLGVAAASVAELVTYPVDLTKTRLQLQNEVAATKGGREAYKGTFKTAYGIAKDEGILKLWSGITPAIMRHVIYSGIRVVVYDQMKDNVLGKNEDGSFPIWKAGVAGVSAGVIGQFAASPADLVKVQYQMEGKRLLNGEPPRYKGVIHAYQTIYRQGGVVGLWKGAVPNVQRSALVNLGDFTAYDLAKQFLIQSAGVKDGTTTHLMSSMFAGFVAAVLGSPADVVKSRIMNQPVDEKGRGLFYKSSVDCVIKTVKSEGLAGLYKGFIPTWMRMAPWSLMFWLSTEHMRVIMGLPAF